LPASHIHLHSKYTFLSQNGTIPQGNHIYNSPSIDTYDYSIYRPHAEPHYEEEKLTFSELH
jgi:hypothetical protein